MMGPVAERKLNVPPGASVGRGTWRATSGTRETQGQGGGSVRGSSRRAVGLPSRETEGRTRAASPEVDNGRERCPPTRRVVEGHQARVR